MDGAAFVALLEMHRAPATIFRIADKDLRDFHANVRKAGQTLEASDNRDDLIKALRKSTGLSDNASTSALLLFSLGHYNLSKGDDGKVPHAFFWARDKGVQTYLDKHNIHDSDVANEIKRLRGTDATYRHWLDEKHDASKKVRKQRNTLEKAVREACPHLKVGDLVAIIARVGKSGKLELVEARKYLDDRESGVPKETTDNSAVRAAAEIVSLAPSSAIMSPSEIV